MTAACAGRPQARAVHDDANEVLPGIIETIRYDDFERALCFLDPYRILLDWQVLCAAGRMRTIEAFIHFPTGDIQIYYSSLMPRTDPCAQLLETLD